MNRVIVVAAVVVGLGSVGLADDFGTGANEFAIDFVTISGATNPSSGHRGIVNNDYRMSIYEITNDQWNKFKAAYGAVTGTPSSAYDEAAYFTGANVPTNEVSWYEAAQFVNWLNTSIDRHAAYKFTGTQGQSDYTFATWSADEADGGTNLYRHKDAFYYMPTENEWVKAGYWNGVRMQTYATPDDTKPLEDVEANYGYESAGQLWNVGSGSEELNGTYDMMGNVWEWVESPWSYYAYETDLYRPLRGGSIDNPSYDLMSSSRHGFGAWGEDSRIGFRVASEVPEPATISLLALSGLAVLRKRRRTDWADRGTPRCARK